MLLYCTRDALGRFYVFLSQRKLLRIDLSAGAGKVNAGEEIRESWSMDAINSE